MALYTVHSERLLCEQLDYHLLFRWFLDLNWDEPSFDLAAIVRACWCTTWRASFFAR
jgi:transposase